MAKGVNSRGMKANGRGSSQRFAGIPHTVMESDSYKQLGGSAVKLLLELARQYNGRNNGDLTTALSLLKLRGFSSSTTVKKAKQELLDADLIIETRTGIFTNPGGRCALYALTWQPIDECPGKNLEVKPTSTPPRKFSMETIKTPEPVSGDSSNQKLDRQRRRDERGRYSSDQKRVRLVVSASTRNW